jgi:type VI secretion system secreted protein VgrG
MSRFTFEAKSVRARAAWATALCALFATGLLVTLVSGAAAAAISVPLGTAQSFAVLAGSGITNTGPTTVTGDVGTFPTNTITGSASLTVTGTNHGGDSVTQGAKTDLVTAYNSAAGEGPTSPIVADLAGKTLPAGVYKSGSSIGLSGVLTLDGGGNPNAVFVFQAGSTLTTASASNVVLINGAQACNVYWQVGSSATLGTGSTFRGTILALTSITVTTGVTVHGRVLARNGAVTLDTDTIARADCAASTTTTGTTGTTTTTQTSTTPTKKHKHGGSGSPKHTHARPPLEHVGLTG